MKKIVIEFEEDEPDMQLMLFAGYILDVPAYIIPWQNIKVSIIIEEEKK